MATETASALLSRFELRRLTRWDSFDYRLRSIIHGYDATESEPCRSEQFAELGVSTLHAALGLDKHAQVQTITIFVGYVFLVGQDSIDDQKSALVWNPVPAVAQNLQALSIAPVVQHTGNEIGVSAGGNLHKQITSEEIASIGNAAFPKRVERALRRAGRSKHVQRMPGYCFAMAPAMAPCAPPRSTSFTIREKS